MLVKRKKNPGAGAVKAFIWDFYHVCFKGESCNAVKTSALNQAHKPFIPGFWDDKAMWDICSC